MRLLSWARLFLTEFPLVADPWNACGRGMTFWRVLTANTSFTQRLIRREFLDGLLKAIL
jgi:hypothetical protein